MDEYNLVFLVNRIDYPVLEGQPERIESVQVSDQLFPTVRILSDGVDADFPELVLELRSELVNIFYCSPCKANFVAAHFFAPRT